MVPSATTSPPKRPARGPEVDDVVGRADRVLVVLHDDHRVAEVAQAAERAQQPLVVALVQADARLVEDVEHAHQSRPDLRREPDALGLAARERRGARVPASGSRARRHSRNRSRSHDLLEDRAGDVRHRARAARPLRAQRNDCEEVRRASHRHFHHVADAPPGDHHRQALRLEPPAAAGLAGLRRSCTPRAGPGSRRWTTRGTAARRSARTPSHSPRARCAHAARPRARTELARRAVQERLLAPRRDLAPGRVEVELRAPWRASAGPPCAGSRTARPRAGPPLRGSRCVGSPRMSSAFTSFRVPRPLQSGQTPKGG